MKIFTQLIISYLKKINLILYSLTFMDDILIRKNYFISNLTVLLIVIFIILFSN